MKNAFLLIIVLFSLSPRLLYSQTSGIKIKNSASIIELDTTNTQIEVNGNMQNVYKTPEIIWFNYNQSIINSKEDSISNITNDLYANSRSTDITNHYSRDLVQSKLAIVKELQRDLKRMHREQDSLFHIYIKDYLQYKRVNVLTFGPKRSSALFDFIYGDTGKRFQVLNNTGFSFGDSTASLYSELVSGNLGVFRVSLGTMISSSAANNSEEAKELEAYQRLATYGGNTVLTFEYPIAYIHTRNNQYNLISRIIAKGTADFPEFGTTTEDFAGSGSLGLDLYADASLSNNSLRFFLNLNFNGILGTDIYRDNLGINNSNFTFGQLTLGLIVMENIKLSFVINSFSSEQSLRNRNVLIGGQILH